MDKSNFGRLISILYRKAHVYKAYHLKKYNITVSEQPFLNVLYKKDGVSQDDLSKYLCIDKASTARAIQSLINKGFAVKVKDENDKRINRIFLTEKGLATKDDVFDVLNTWSEILTSDMSSEEKELANSFLERMALNIEDYFKKGGCR